MRRAAILLTMRMRDDGEPEVLMIKRADAENDPWSGHIALPWRAHGAGDADLAVTAVRETWEETGVDVARDGRMLGFLDDLMPALPDAAADRDPPVRGTRARRGGDRGEPRGRGGVLGSVVRTALDATRGASAPCTCAASNGA